MADLTAQTTFSIVPAETLTEILDLEIMPEGDKFNCLTRA